MIKRTLQELCLNITDGKHGDCENEENSGYYFNNSDYLQKARKYGHFTGYKN